MAIIGLQKGSGRRSRVREKSVKSQGILIWIMSGNPVSVIRGIKHDFPFINIRKVPREVLKTKGFARGFQPSRGTLRMVMNDNIIFDRYYCINSTKHCENEENIGTLYFITSSHFPTQVRYA